MMRSGLPMHMPSGTRAGVGARGLPAELRQQAERRVRARRVRLARGERAGREIVERAGEPPAGLHAGLVVLVAVEEVDRVHLLVHELADRLAELDAAAVLGDLLLLLGEAAERQAEAAEAAVGGVELGAGRLVTATHIGGCGFWYGFGRMARDGIENASPW